MRGIRNLKLPKLEELELGGYKFSKRAGSSVLHITMPDGTAKSECMDGVPLTKEFARKFIIALGENKHYVNNFSAEEKARADRGER
jgi:hypothetical protein